MARAWRQRLDTTKSRKDSLTIHINHGIWKPTPFISFYNSARALQNMAERRARKGNRGAQHVVAIDPSVRLEAGLSILNVLAEMYHYNIEDPYRLGNLYYNDEYLCLWQVSAEGIIGQWDWDDDLARNGNWYEKIVAPAFREFRRKRELQTRFSQDGSQDLTTAMSNLSLGSGASDLGYRGYSAGSDVPYQETDTENEEPAPGYEVEVAYGWGTETDDDLEEEVLSTDDIIRIIEGDWD